MWWRLYPFSMGTIFSRQNIGLLIVFPKLLVFCGTVNESSPVLFVLKILREAPIMWHLEALAAIVLKLELSYLIQWKAI